MTEWRMILEETVQLDNPKYLSEFTFLKSVIDLAIGKKPPGKSSKKETDEIDYLPFHFISQSWEDLSHQLKVSHSLKEKCYQLLLLMSADNSMTWWEKLHKIGFYMKMLPKHLRGSPVTKSAIVKTVSHDPYLLSRGSKDEHVFDHIGRYSTMKPSDLEESSELSYLLNNRTKEDYFHLKGQLTSNIGGRQTRLLMTTPKTKDEGDQNSRSQRIDVSSMLEDKINSIEKETKVTQGLLSSFIQKVDDDQSKQRNALKSSVRSPSMTSHRQVDSIPPPPPLSPVVPTNVSFTETMKMVHSPDFSMTGECKLLYSLFPLSSLISAALCFLSLFQDMHPPASGNSNILSPPSDTTQKDDFLSNYLQEEDEGRERESKKFNLQDFSVSLKKSSAMSKYLSQPILTVSTAATTASAAGDNDDESHDLNHSPQRNSNRSTVSKHKVQLNIPDDLLDQTTFRITSNDDDEEREGDREVHNNRITPRKHVSINELKSPNRKPFRKFLFIFFVLSRL
jgi:hypothetical protein